MFYNWYIEHVIVNIRLLATCSFFPFLPEFIYYLILNCISFPLSNPPCPLSSSHFSPSQNHSTLMLFYYIHSLRGTCIVFWKRKTRWWWSHYILFCYIPSLRGMHHGSPSGIYVHGWFIFIVVWVTTISLSDAWFRPWTPRILHPSALGVFWCGACVGGGDGVVGFKLWFFNNFMF